MLRYKHIAFQQQIPETSISQHFPNARRMQAELNTILSFLNKKEGKVLTLYVHGSILHTALGIKPNDLDTVVFSKTFAQSHKSLISEVQTFCKEHQFKFIYLENPRTSQLFCQIQTEHCDVTIYTYDEYVIPQGYAPLSCKGVSNWDNRLVELDLSDFTLKKQGLLKLNSTYEKEYSHIEDVSTAFSPEFNQGLKGNQFNWKSIALYLKLKSVLPELQYVLPHNESSEVPFIDTQEISSKIIHHYQKQYPHLAELIEIRCAYLFNPITELYCRMGTSKPNVF